MQVNHYQGGNSTFTGFKFSPVSKERFYKILESTNDPILTNKCRSIIASQKDNPVDIEVTNLNHCFGQIIDNGLEAWINGKYSHDNIGMNELGFISLKSFINGNFLQEQKTRVVADFFDAEKNRLSQDPELVKIYKEEMANFVKNVPRRIRNFAQYFSDYAHTQTNNGLEEAFAEIEALINNVKIPKFVYRRAHLLQENFPKTIAYLMQRRI